MEEDCRLGDICSPEVFVASVEHDVCDAESENLIGLLHHLTCLQTIVVQVFSHTRELCALTGKYICFFHIQSILAANLQQFFH